MEEICKVVKWRWHLRGRDELDTRRTWYWTRGRCRWLVPQHHCYLSHCLPALFRPVYFGLFVFGIREYINVFFLSIRETVAGSPSNFAFHVIRAPTIVCLFFYFLDNSNKSWRLIVLFGARNHKDRGRTRCVKPKLSLRSAHRWLTNTIARVTMQLM